MAMMRKTITISEVMEDWIKSQIASGRYGNDSEYFRDLIRKDQDERFAVRGLEALIKEGIDSGISDHDINDIMQHVEGKLNKDGRLPVNK